MHTITFSYEDREYEASILSSTIREPYFYWLMFDDPHLLKLTGGDDSICFEVVQGKLRCVSMVLDIKCPELVKVARGIIEAHLNDQK